MQAGRVPALLDTIRSKPYPAGLNFGDCLAYALARETGEALVIKGDGFGKTDLDLVAAPS